MKRKSALCLTLACVLLLTAVLPSFVSCRKETNAEPGEKPEKEGTDMNVLNDTQKPNEPGTETGKTEKSVPTVAVASLLSAFKTAGLSMHSVLIMRHGEIVAECYASPFDENSKHRMYSVSKTFVGMSVGLLLSDERYGDCFPDGIDTKIGDLACFAEYVKPSTDRRITDTKIRDLLRMAAPFPKGSTYDGANDMDWLATFFAPSSSRSPDHESGTKFLYDTSASYVLGVMVERITGMTFLEYLQRNALDEIGFSRDAWCVSAPEGYAWGGSGVMCTTRDLARFAELVMHNGVANGKQLLPSDFVKAATTSQIAITASDDENSIGYGYQIWITDFGFAFLGMGCQYAFCVPSMDLVFVCTADNQGYKRDGMDGESTIFSLFRRHLLLSLTEDKFTETAADREYLALVKDAFAIPAQAGKTSTKTAEIVNGKTYSGSGNAFSEFSLSFSGQDGVLSYTTPRGKKELRFGLGENLIGTLDEPQYSGKSIHHPNGKGYRALCSGAWTDENTFVLWVQVCDDYFGNMKMTFDFSGETATVTITKTAEWFLDEYKMKSTVYRAR